MGDGMIDEKNNLFLSLSKEVVAKLFAGVLAVLV